MIDNFNISNDIVFDPKPEAVPYNYRISYKVSQICLIIHICGWANTCSLIKIHMISYALLSREYMDSLINFSAKKNNSILIHFDPAVNRAVDFAVGYGFVKQQNSKKYKLTQQGISFVERIILDKTLLTSEIKELSQLSKKLTEKRIDELIELWGRQYADD